MKTRALKRFAIFAAGALALALAACEMPFVAGGSSSTETGKKIQYLGRVANGAGEGIPGVIVTIEGTAAADTTDLSGAYRVTGRSKKSAETLHFSLRGQTLMRKTVSVKQDEVPELRLAQRGFSGKLYTGSRAVGGIEGVVTGDGIAPGDSMKVIFHHNTLANNYSGFVYFPATGNDSLRAYAVRVDVFDSAGVRVAQSANVSFTSLAGNIVIPDFGFNKAGASR